MAKFLGDNVLDAALSYISSNATTLYLCSAQPTDYTTASSTYALTNDATISWGSPLNGTTGRKIAVPETSGTVSGGGGTATYWALTDGTSELIAYGTLSSSKALATSDTWTLATFDIEISDPT